MDVQLPQELLQQIFSYLSGDQKALNACSLTSQSWYSASIAYLYEDPIISGKGYSSFVRAICPSVNAHVRRNGLADLVRRLDMSSLVHNGSKSLTARLLGRVKTRLEEFVAPQASFAVNCLAALSKCSNLRHLDLSFVSESISMTDLLRSTSLLSKLESLHLPRSSAHDASRDIMICSWPASLRELHISGGIHDEALVSLGTLPSSVSSLSIRNCPHLSMVSIGTILKTKGSQLHHLEVVAPIPALARDHKPLSGYMEYVPNLRSLKISLDFISRSFMLLENDKADRYPLRQLDLDCFDPADCEAFNAYDLWAAIAYDNGFGRVRKVRVHRRLGWAASEEGTEQVKDLDELLKALAREDGASAEIKEADAGVVLFGKW
ncbi:MAG: hypothetical protein ALECFALPRED_003806 [Alectoria fallacina]|uniref:F-box domain-containing protein n=1 Tax=Alectoria fallacina TaxID=1903189 RepID=A0A8H3FTR7_9LECA|nr:MAG: hypothetical protein ALECFALPRED_003806 [Alectoria fallacina]